MGELVLAAPRSRGSGRLVLTVTFNRLPCLNFRMMKTPLADPTLLAAPDGSSAVHLPRLMREADQIDQTLFAMRDWDPEVAALGDLDAPTDASLLRLESLLLRVQKAEAESGQGSPSEAPVLWPIGTAQPGLTPEAEALLPKLQTLYREQLNRKLSLAFLRRLVSQNRLNLDSKARVDPAFSWPAIEAHLQRLRECLGIGGAIVLMAAWAGLIWGVHNPSFFMGGAIAMAVSMALWMNLGFKLKDLTAEDMRSPFWQKWLPKRMRADAHG